MQFDKGLNANYTWLPATGKVSSAPAAQDETALAHGVAAAAAEAAVVIVVAAAIRSGLNRGGGVWSEAVVSRCSFQNMVSRKIG